jgi:RNA polymerase sigma-70 factor (ECF subfamily)
VTDEEIVMLVQNGKTDEYGEIVKRYEKVLFRYIKRVTNQELTEVEDLVQETLISGYENIMGFDPKQKFSSWIFRIGHNKCIDFFRKRKLKTTTTNDKEELIESNDKLMEELEIEKENKEKVNAAVRSLELKYKEVILLYYFEDKSYEEISDILHTQTTNVGVMLKRAREKLCKII